jgi:hypothetical protein
LLVIFDDQRQSVTQAPPRNPVGKRLNCPAVYDGFQLALFPLHRATAKQQILTLSNVYFRSQYGGMRACVNHRFATYLLAKTKACRELGPHEPKRSRCSIGARLCHLQLRDAPVHEAPEADAHSTEAKTKNPIALY